MVAALVLPVECLAAARLSAGERAGPMLPHVPAILTRTAERGITANWTRQGALTGRLRGSCEGGRGWANDLILGQGWNSQIVVAIHDGHRVWLWTVSELGAFKAFDDFGVW